MAATLEAGPAAGPPSSKRVIRAVGTGRPLKPGQRNPTVFDRDEAYWDGQEPPSNFPLGCEWELTEDRCRRWRRHDFSGRRGDTNAFRRMGDLAGDEFALLLWDLDLYKALVLRWELGRGPEPPPLHVYLRESRENWGLISQAMRELGWLNWLDEGGG